MIAKHHIDVSTSELFSNGTCGRPPVHPTCFGRWPRPCTRPPHPKTHFILAKIRRELKSRIMTVGTTKIANTKGPNRLLTRGSPKWKRITKMWEDRETFKFFSISIFSSEIDKKFKDENWKSQRKFSLPFKNKLGLRESHQFNPDSHEQPPQITCVKHNLFRERFILHYSVEGPVQ